MAKSQQTFNKLEKEKKRLKKRQDKQQKKDERKANPTDGSLESMMAYIDENGNITDTPPDPTKKIKINAKDIEIVTPKKEDIPEETVRTGIVDFFNDSKGFGFIIDQNTKEKFFVHVKGLVDDIKEGNKVSFELERGMKGMNAVNVKQVK